MRTAQSLAVTLPDELTQLIDGKIASGEYASASDVICEALRGLQQRDAAVEDWLRDEVLPAYDAHLKNPTDVLTIDQVLDRLTTRAQATRRAAGQRA